MGFFKTISGGKFRPIRKVKAGITAAVITTAVKWIADTFGMELDGDAVKQIVSAIQATIQFGGDVWIPIVTAWFVKSDPQDAENLGWRH